MNDFSFRLAQVYFDECMSVNLLIMSVCMFFFISRIEEIKWRWLAVIEITYIQRLLVCCCWAYWSHRSTNTCNTISEHYLIRMRCVIVVLVYDFWHVAWYCNVNIKLNRLLLIPTAVGFLCHFFFQIETMPKIYVYYGKFE